MGMNSGNSDYMWLKKARNVQNMQEDPFKTLHSNNVARF